MFKTFSTTLLLMLIGSASISQEAAPPVNPFAKPPEQKQLAPEEQPQIVPPGSMFQQQTHIKMVIPCGPTGQLDAYLRDKEKQNPLAVGKTFVHLLGPNNVELRTPSTTLVYVGDMLSKEAPWSLVLMFPNGLECLLTVGNTFTPVSNN